MGANKRDTITHPGWSEIFIAGEKTVRTEIEVPIQIRAVCEVCKEPIEWGFERDKQGSITMMVSKINCECLIKKE